MAWGIFVACRGVAWQGLGACRMPQRQLRVSKQLSRGCNQHTHTHTERDAPTGHWTLGTN